MSSPTLFASDEELSDVQVMDSDEPLVTASSSRRSARVRDSYEPLVPTVIVRVFEWDSDEPLVPASSSVSARVLDSTEPLATACSDSARVLDSLEPLVPIGPSSLLEIALPLVTPVARASTSGSPRVAAAAAAPAASDSSSEEDEEYPPVLALPTVAKRTGSTGRRVNPYSDELRSMWNWRKIHAKLGTNAQCIEFAEERGLLPRTKMCSTHRRPMSLTARAGQVGKFWCRKSTCRTNSISRAMGTWFENATLTLTLIFEIMYAFSEGLSYHQTRKELSNEACPVVSTQTVAYWFNYCRETVAIYELETQKAQGKIPNKTDQIDNLTDCLCEYAWRRRIMVDHLDPYEELIKAIKYVYKIDQ